MVEQIKFKLDMGARPKGSWRTYCGKGIKGCRPGLKCDNERTKPFEQLVHLQAKALAPNEPIAGPVWVNILAVYPQPDADLKKATSRNPTRQPRAGKWRWPCLQRKGEGDLDKICRAVLDGLQGAVFKNDAQVCSLNAQKQYGTPGIKPYTVVTCGPLPEYPDPAPFSLSDPASPVPGPAHRRL